MTEEEQKLIKRLEDDIELVYFPSNFGKGEFIMNINLSDLKIILKLISKLQADIEIKDKVIDLMANQLSIASDRYEYMEETEIIEYFYKKVGGEDG